MAGGTYGLGVDLGTTYTAAAAWRDGRAEAVPLGTRAHTVASVLYLREDDVLLVGEAAVRSGATRPDRTAREFKRNLGDGIPFLLGDSERTAEELTGQLLRWVVGEVTTREGGPPAHVTLTHPANWGEYRTRLLVTAAEEAGLGDVGLLVEPVAAAAYHASTQRLPPGAALAVYDLGGGTFDATVVRKTATGFAVEGTPSGDDALGGVDFDQAVMDHVTAALGPAWHGLDLTDPGVLAAAARVREQAVEAKEALSVDVDATVPVILPGLTREVPISRRDFEAVVRIPVLRTVDLLAQAVATAGLSTTDLHAVLLVGGSSRIPLVSRLIADELGVPVALDAHPKYAVCLGAAIAAGARLAPPPARPAPASPPPGLRPTPSGLRPAVPPPLPDLRPEVPPSGLRPAVPPSGLRPAVSPSGLRPVAPPTGSRPTPTPSGLRRATPRPVPPGAPATPPPGPRPVAPPPARRPAATLTDLPPAPLQVDLSATGITTTVDTAVPTTPTVPAWRPVVTDEDLPLVITVTGDRRRGRRVGLIAAGVAAFVVAVVAVVAALLLVPGTGSTVVGAAPTGAAVAPSAVALAGTARLVGEPVTTAAGERMRALAATPSGAVAVGASDTEGTPRAWRADASGAWTPARFAQPAGLVGAVNGVAAGPGGRLVAVGWASGQVGAASAPVGPTRRAAVWTSPDGAVWTYDESAVGGAGLGELTDVVVAPGGEFVAAGTDWTADPGSGDGTVLTSADGTAWQAQPVVGLGGRGPTVLHRLMVDGGGFVAVGNRSDAGIGQPAVWTSPDAISWAPGPVLPHSGAGGGEATGVARAPGGRLVVVGRTSTVGGGAAAVWWGPDAAGLQPCTVDVRDAVLDGVALRDGRLNAVGATDAGAAAWTLEITA